MSAQYSLCVVVPVYNHEHAIGDMVSGILAHGLHCLLVDDGSKASCAAELDRLAAVHSGHVTLLRLPVNQGKGRAMLAGFKAAFDAGYTHALQIDADGQHDPADIPKFMAQSAARPAHIINGCPQYDESVPRARLYGRYATHIWVWINTLSFAIRDSMCGYRIYPLAPVVALIGKEPIGARMDFDTEIIVRLFWRGVPVINQLTRVRYPQDGVSHFRVWADNARISWMHTRLFFGMLRRLPVLLFRKLAHRECCT